jgi:hypothetical protein
LFEKTLSIFSISSGRRKFLFFPSPYSASALMINTLMHKMSGLFLLMTRIAAGNPVPQNNFGDKLIIPSIIEPLS